MGDLVGDFSTLSHLLYGIFTCYRADTVENAVAVCSVEVK